MRIEYKINKYGTPSTIYGEIIRNDGSIVHLTDQAEQTSRVLPDNQSGAEWSAPGKTDDGRRVNIYWIFDEADDVDADEYDWSDVDRIEEVD